MNKIKVNIRFKILLSIVFSCLVLLIKDWISFIFTTLITILTSIFFKVSFKKFFKKNKVLLITSLASLIFSCVYDAFWIYTIKNRIFSFSPLILNSIHTQFWLNSFKKYLLIFLKFINLILINFTVLNAISTNEISNAIESFLKPFEFLGFSSKEIAMTLVLSLRFFSILKKQWQKLSQAQKSRCIKNEKFNLIKILKKYIHISSIFLKLCFKKQEIMSQALKSRCWNVNS